MNLFSSPLRVPRPSYPFPGTFGKLGNGPFPKQAKTVNRVPLGIARESTCSKHQYDLYVISVASSKTELSI